MKFGIVGNIEKPELTEAVPLFIACLRKHGIDYLLEESIVRLLSSGGRKSADGSSATTEQCIKNADIVVAFGGDGTMLSVAQMVGKAGSPILGINLGKLGFLAEVAPSEMQEAIEDIIKNRYVIEERLVLRGICQHLPTKEFWAANDIVLGKARSTRLIDVETHINGAFAVTYRGDGLIISTPTGSTAYALSNGGPIVIPTCDVLGLTPISPHTLSGRPLIVPGDAVIRMVAHASGEEVLLSADGREEAYAQTPLEVEIRRADHTLRLVKRFNRSYFDVLRAKLYWGQDPRTQTTG